MTSANEETRVVPPGANEETRVVQPIQEDDTQEIPAVVPVGPPPPPTLIRPRPVEAEDHQSIDEAHRRGRAGIIAAMLGVLLLGLIGGWLWGATSTANEARTNPAVVETTATMEKTATATATATKTKTKTKTEVDVRTVTAPPPAPETKTVTVEKTVTEPAEPRPTVTIERLNTPESCILAVEAAQRYINAVERDRRGGRRAALRDFLNYSEQCRNQE